MSEDWNDSEEEIDKDNNLVAPQSQSSKDEEGFYMPEPQANKKRSLAIFE